MGNDFKEIFGEKERKGVTFKEVFMLVAFLICMTVGWYSATYRIPWYIVYISEGIVTVFAVMTLGISGNVDDFKRPMEATVTYGIAYLLMMIVTFLLNAYQFNTVRVMTRGMSDILYQLIGIAFVCACVYLFKYRALYYVFYSMVICYLIVFICVGREFGFVQTLLDVKAVVFSGAANTKASAALEVHDLTFAIGAFLCYFVLNFKNEKKPFINIIIAVAAIFLGYKRFIFPAVVICFIYYHFMGFLQKRLGRRSAFMILLFIQIALVAVSFVYMITIKEGIFEKIMNSMDIDTMGRITLYNKIEKFYSISPAYVGKGLGWVNRNLQSITGHLHGTEGLHCNILELYIELGFWGFVIFFGYQLVVQSLLINKLFGIGITRLYTALYMYCWLTYLTDNTVFYRAINVAVRVIVVACIALGHERSKKTWNQAVKSDAEQETMFRLLN